MCRHLKRIVEVAVVQRAVPRDGEERLAHEVVDGGDVERVDLSAEWEGAGGGEGFMSAHGAESERTSSCMYSCSLPALYKKSAYLLHQSEAQREGGG